MQVDLYLRWILYLELFALFIVFLPILAGVKRALLLQLAPLFSKIQLVFWIFWSFIGFIFVSSAKDAYFSDNATNATTLDATAKLDLARNERDAMMSFIALLLLPLIHLHGKSVVRIYKLQQSLTAMTKQATNASNQLMAMLNEKGNTPRKGKDTKQQSDKKEVTGKEADVDAMVLRDELSLYKARFQKAAQTQKQLRSELEETKDKLAAYENPAELKKKV